MKIVPAITKEQIEAVRVLFRDYETELNVDLHFQSFQEEVNSLPGRYGSPGGILLLVEEKGEYLGCGAVRKLDDTTCEMKRLFVKPEFRGRGLGKIIARLLIRKAVTLGYSDMLLDTLEKLKEANILYQSLGFIKTAPYYHNPLPGVIYWKLNLSNREEILSNE